MKNRTVNNLKNIRFLFFLLGVAVSANAQTPPPFPDDVDDVAPVVPIDGWIIPIVILSSILGCYIIRKNIKEKNKMNFPEEI
nr:hypothetical protein [uncultured Flavobacterium sp.]